MGSIFDITAMLRANTSQFTSGMKNAGKQARGFSKEMSMLKGQLLTVFSVAAVVSFTKTSLEAYDEQIKADTKLLQAMKGREDAQKRMSLLASDLQKKTLFADEKSVDAMARMASILGDNEDVIKRLLPLVQDFATVKGMDLASAAELISKTVASSTNSLSRYGIQVEGSAGSVERLNSLMAALNKNFAGQSEAAALVGLGPIQQLKNQINDLQEAYAKWIVNSKVTQSIIKDWTTQLTIWGDANLSFWQKLFTLPEKYIQNLEKAKSTQSDFLGGESEGGPLAPKLVVPKQIETITTLNEKLKDAKEILENINVLDIEGIEAQKEIISKLQIRIEKLSDIKSIDEELKDGLEGYLKTLEKVNKEQETRNKLVEIFFKNKDINIPVPMDGSNIAAKNQGIPKGLIGDDITKRAKKIATDSAKIMDDLAMNIRDTLIFALGDFVNTIFTDVAEGVASLKLVGKSLLDIFASILTQLGGAYIAAGIAMLAIDASRGTRMIVGGMGLMAAGGLVKGISNRMNSQSSVTNGNNMKQQTVLVTGTISNETIKISNKRGDQNSGYGLRYQ